MTRGESEGQLLTPGSRPRSQPPAASRLIEIGIDGFNRSIGAVLQFRRFDIAQVCLPARELRVVVEQIPLSFELHDRVVIRPTQYGLEDLPPDREGTVR